MRELLLIRHGATQANERHAYAGASDVPLSEKGMQALLAVRDQYPKAVCYFTSGMRRARQTLEILYGDVPSMDIPALAECRLGAFEGHTHDELYAQSPVYRAWLAETGDAVVCPGGESRQAFDARVVEGWRLLAAQPWSGLAVLVTHGGVIASLLRQLAPDAPSYIDTPNGGGWRLSLDAAGGIAACQAWARA